MDDSDPKAAIKALGVLLRVTEVFIWEDGWGGASRTPGRRRSLDEEPDCFSVDAACSNITTELKEHNIVDPELAQELCALGLPLSFGTAKGKKNMVGARKRKGSKKKALASETDPKNSECNTMEQVSADSLQPFCDRTNSSFHDTRDCQGKIPCDDAEMELNRSILHSNGDIVFQLAANGEIPEKHIVDRGDESINSGSNAIDTLSSSLNNNDTIEDVCHVDFNEKQYDYKHNNKELEHASDMSSTLGPGDEYVNMEDTGAVLQGSLDSFQQLLLVDNCQEDTSEDSRHPNYLGNWTVAWDSFYMRNYYYNFVTQESSWYPPSGLEHSLFSTSPDEILVDAAEDESNLDSTSNFTLGKVNPGEVHGDTVKDESVKESALSITADNSHGGLQENAFIAGERVDGDLSAQSCCEVTSGSGPAFGNLISNSNHYSASINQYHLGDDVEPICSESTKSSGEDPITSSHSPDLTLMDTSHGICEEPALFPSTSSAGLRAEEKSGSFMLQRAGTHSTSSRDGHHDSEITNNKKRVRRIKPCQKLYGEINASVLPEEMEGLSGDIVKYWCQRYSLFKRFDYGIKMDEEGWFSVTPELVAKHHACRCGKGVVIDCFAGVGGNAIQFAMKNNHVIAIDIDPQKIKYAYHNASIYGVQERIDFVQGDFFHLSKKLKADVVFLSPPWGGPDYLKVQSYNVKTMLRPRDGYFLFKVATNIAPKVVMFLPRNVDINQLAELSLLSDPPWDLEVEKNFLNGKLKAVTAYFSDTSSRTVG